MSDQTKMRDLIEWLLGEKGEFSLPPERVPGKPFPHYWWRKELRKRWEAIQACEAAKVGQEPVGEIDKDGMSVFWSNKPINGAKLYTDPPDTVTIEQRGYVRAIEDARRVCGKVASEAETDVPTALKCLDDVGALIKGM